MYQIDEIKLYIHGKYVTAKSGKTFDSINPATGEIIAKVHQAGLEDVNYAVDSCKEGFSKWSKITGTERGRILQKAQKILKSRNDELSKIETMDCGKPIQESSTVDIYWGADCIEYYAGLASTISGSHFDFQSSYVYTKREPVGV